MYYREAIEFIKNVERAGVELGLERMRELLDLIGEPDRSLKFVHVAGTNGKGSVCAYLTSIFVNAGYVTGTYNSPSVFSYNERFLINGVPLADEKVAKFLTEIKNVIYAENANRKITGGSFTPTAFEIETAVAMLAFADAGCGICVLETGMGGRWDATNAIKDKELAVITPIGLDHCAVLGDTLSEIAAEKAAIIRGDAVTILQSDEIMRELRRPYVIENGKKKYIQARLNLADEPRVLKDCADGQTFILSGKEYNIKMLGAHQRENAALAVKAVQLLNSKGWKITDEAVEKGLAETIWPARFEIVKNSEKRFDIAVPKGKTLVLDGTHNPHGAKSLAKSINKYIGNKRICLIIGVLKDKDVSGILGELLPLASEVICVTPLSPRALDKNELKAQADAINSSGIKISVCRDIKAAVERGLNGECGAAVLCGSLTLFGALNKPLADKQ